jgi:hypothetical protein
MIASLVEALIPASLARMMKQDEVPVRNPAVNQLGAGGVVDARVVAVVADEPTAGEGDEQAKPEGDGKDDDVGEPVRPRRIERPA